jgi:hypothetical protein
MSTPDFCALITEMADELDRQRRFLRGLHDDCVTHPLADRARAALAQPEGEGASDDAWWHELVSEIARVQHVAAGEGQGPRFDLAEAVVRWCHPTPPAPEPGEVVELVRRLRDWHSIPLLQEVAAWLRSELNLSVADLLLEQECKRNA